MLLTKKSVKFQQIINYLEDPRLTLREKQDRILQLDVESVLSYREWIQDKTQNIFDHKRMLGIVAVSEGSENYLPYTIPKIIQQIATTGMMADIIIGLNNGFECPDVIEGFTLFSNIQVIYLYTAEKIANNIPAEIFDNWMCIGQPYCLTNVTQLNTKHRIFIIKQKKGIYSAGKLRVLNDIYGSLLINSIDNGWIPPKFLFTFDAETLFLVEKKYSIIEPESNGLKFIVNYLQNHSEIDILGTRMKMAVYQKSVLENKEVLLPNFSEELPPLQCFLDIVHGRYSSYQYKPGGGTVGKTDVIISLLLLISERYPGSKNEDTHLSILAKHAGFTGEIFLDVISVNRSPHILDMTRDNGLQKDWIRQMYRWIAASQSLELLYGFHNTKIIVNMSFPWFITKNPMKFLKLMKGNKKISLHSLMRKLQLLLIAFFTFRQIKKKSVENPDILQGSRAKVSW